MVESIFMSYESYMKLLDSSVLGVTNSLILEARLNTMKEIDGKNKFVLVEYNSETLKLEKEIGRFDSRFEAIDFINSTKDIICASADLQYALAFAPKSYNKTLQQKILAFGDMQDTPRFFNNMDIKLNLNNFKNVLFGLTKLNRRSALKMEPVSFATLMHFIDNICSILNYKDDDKNMKLAAEPIVDRITDHALNTGNTMFYQFNTNRFSRYCHRFSEAAVEKIYDLIEDKTYEELSDTYYNALFESFFIFVNNNSDISNINPYKALKILHMINMITHDTSNRVGFIFARLVNNFTEEEIKTDRIIQRFIYRYGLHTKLLDIDYNDYAEYYVRCQETQFTKFKSIYYFLLPMFTDEEFYKSIKEHKLNSLIYRMESDMFRTKYREGLSEVFSLAIMDELELKLYSDNKRKFEILFDAVIDLLLDDYDENVIHKLNSILDNNLKVKQPQINMVTLFINRLEERFLLEDLPNIDLVTRVMIDKTI